MLKRFCTLAMGACLMLAASAPPAFADLTAFPRIQSHARAPSRPRRCAVGSGLVVVGFEFEYADTSDDEDTGAPSLKTGMANLLLQTPIPIGRFQPYFTDRRRPLSRTRRPLDRSPGDQLRQQHRRRRQDDARPARYGCGSIIACSSCAAIRCIRRVHRFYGGLESRILGGMYEGPIGPRWAVGDRPEGDRSEPCKTVAICRRAAGVMRLCGASRLRRRAEIRQQGQVQQTRLDECLPSPWCRCRCTSVGNTSEMIRSGLV